MSNDNVLVPNSYAKWGNKWGRIVSVKERGSLKMITLERVTFEGEPWADPKAPANVDRREIMVTLASSLKPAVMNLKYAELELV
jgi:hypothetical protein